MSSKVGATNQSERQDGEPVSKLTSPMLPGASDPPAMKAAYWKKVDGKLALPNASAKEVDGAVDQVASVSTVPTPTGVLGSGLRHISWRWKVRGVMGRMRST